jgi:hypothetical protein
MATDRRPIYGTLILLAILLAALLIIQPYSADWPGSGYAKSARRYIRAALRHDSVTLRELSASDGPVLWALRAARRHPDTLALWSRRVEAFAGERRGDTTEVFVYAPAEPCGGEPIVLRFVGSGATGKVLEASSACLSRLSP